MPHLLIHFGPLKCGEMIDIGEGRVTCSTTGKRSSRMVGKEAARALVTLLVVRGPKKLTFSGLWILLLAPMGMLSFHV